MTSLVDDLVPAELWAIVEPLLPVPPRPPYGGRRRAVPDRNCFAAIQPVAESLWGAFVASSVGHDLCEAVGDRGVDGERVEGPLHWSHGPQLCWAEA
jgi:hypothetical protein